MPWPQLGHSCSTVARVDFRFIVCSVLPEAQAGAALAFVRVSRGSEALDSVNKHEAPQFEHCSGSRAGISRKLPQWPQNKLPPMESTTRRLSAILRAYVVFGVLVCEALVCDCEPSVVLDLFVITRDSVRYYLAIGVSSAGARESVETGRGSGAA